MLQNVHFADHQSPSGTQWLTTFVVSTTMHVFNTKTNSFQIIDEPKAIPMNDKDALAAVDAAKATTAAAVYLQ